MGGLKKFTLDNTRRFMPPELRTDPDEELEERILPPDSEIGEHLPPPERVNNAPCQLEERKLVEPPGGFPAMDEERMNRPSRARQPLRGSRIDGLPIGPRIQPWQEREDDLLCPDKKWCPFQIRIYGWDQIQESRMNTVSTTTTAMPSGPPCRIIRIATLENLELR